MKKQLLNIYICLYHLNYFLYSKYLTILNENKILSPPGKMDVFNSNCIFDFYDDYAFRIFFSFQAGCNIHFQTA